MKIGFDGRYAERDLVGVGKYIKFLLQELNKRGINCVIFYSGKPKFAIYGKNIKSIILPTKNRYIFEQIALPLALKKEKVDLYHALGNVGIPIFCPVLAVLTVHDIVPLEIGDYFSYSPTPFLSKFSYLFRLKSSLLRAKRVITVSKFVKKELEKKLNIPADKIRTIYSGRPILESGGSLPTNLKNQKYILNHGGIDIRKNLDRLVKAFSLVHGKYDNLKLVITGENIRIKSKLDKLITNLKLRNSIIFTGYVDDKILGAIIKNASLICYPTLSEGFGFPILESFSVRVPVITSNTSSIPEIAGDSAILINPKNKKEISGAIMRVLKDNKLSRALVESGFEQVKKFSWKEAVNEYLNLYNSIK